MFLFLIGPGKNNFQWVGKKYTQKWKESEESGRTQEEIALGGQASRWQQIQGDLFRGQTEWDNWMNQQQQNWPLFLSLSTYLLYLFLQVSDPALSVQWTDEHMDKFCYSYFDQTCVLTTSPKKIHTRFDSHQRSLIRQNGKFSSSQIVMNPHIYFGTVQSLILIFKILWWDNERCSSKKKKTFEALGFPHGWALWVTLSKIVVFLDSSNMEKTSLASS